MSTHVTLDNHFEAFVQGQLSSGRYTEAGDVVKEGLRLLEERERRLASLDTAIERGMADVKAGRTQSVEEVAAEFRGKYTRIAKERGTL